MRGSVPNKAEQIEALIRGEAYYLALKYAGRDQSGSPQYSKVFSVTREEIDVYIRRNYNLMDLPFAYSSPSPRDGFYVIDVDGKYQVYNQERGIRFEGAKKYTRDKPRIYTEDEAWTLIVDHILRTSGTGLEWK